MSFRTWMYVFAIAGLALTASGQAQEQTQDTQGEEGQQQAAPGELPLPLPIEIVEDEASAESRERREDESRNREIADLAAQEGMNAATQSIDQATRDMRDYSLYSTIAVYVGTLLLIATLLLTWGANRAANRAVTVTEKIGKDQSRAYVHIKTIHIKLGDVNGKPKAVCMFFVENSGITPCKRFEITGGVDIILHGEDIKALPTPEEEGQGWSALRGTEVLTAPRVFDMPPVAHITQSYCIHVGGVVKYTTFFDEEFETEFSFMRRVPLKLESDSEHGAKMSRTPLKLRVYEKQEQA